jgi:ribonucleoside-triphosphate reductase
MQNTLTPLVSTRLHKRDGSLVPFDAEKIRQALIAAGTATGEYQAADVDLLLGAVLARLRGIEQLDVEQIQDSVERVLMDAGYFLSMRAYIVYREQHGRLRRDRKTLVEVATSMNEYLDREDWRVQANANQGYSLGGLVLNVSGKVTANYWLDEVYSQQIGRAHREADLHIHDLDMLAGYCAGWSLRSLLHEGLNGVPGRVEAGPPKHLSSALGQMVNFLGTLQNEWAGAQAFSSFDTYLAPYVRKDQLSYPEVRQAVQEFIYNLNVPSRWGTQTPFTNLTFDWVCPEDLREQVPVIGGEEMPFAYGDLQTEMELINRAYIEVMLAGLFLEAQQGGAHVVEQLERERTAFSGVHTLLVPGEVAQHLVHAIEADGGEVVAQGAQVALGIGVQPGVHVVLDHLALDLQAFHRHVHQAVQALQQA